MTMKRAEEKKGESETIAGFILEISGRFPKVGEKILFEHYVFTIEALDQKRIKQLKVVKNQLMHRFYPLFYWYFCRVIMINYQNLEPS